VRGSAGGRVAAIGDDRAATAIGGDL